MEPRSGPFWLGHFDADLSAMRTPGALDRTGNGAEAVLLLCGLPADNHLDLFV
jgi:hypothetical protein